jgi:hypothetical protein
MCELLAEDGSANLQRTRAICLRRNSALVENSTLAAASEGRISDRCGVFGFSSRELASLGCAHSGNKAFLGLTQ